MSRSLQFIGLPTVAIDLLHKQDTQEVCRTCSNARVLAKYTAKVYESFDAWYGEMVDLHEYYEGETLVYKEVVQADPWSSGPCIFLKLVDANDVDVVAWTEEEIEKYL